jgi:hypothetical protein
MDTEPLSGVLLENLSGRISEAGFFQTSQAWGRSRVSPFRKATASFFRPRKLTQDLVRSMGDSSHTDVLVSLDHLALQTKTKLQLVDFPQFRATRDVAFNSFWTVFDVKADTMLVQFQCTDSLYWERYSAVPMRALALLPKTGDQLSEIGEVLARKVVKNLSPYWETVERPYFTSGSYRMKFAADRLRQKDWEGAAELWRTEYEKGWGKSVYRAAMNMMLYCEYMGNPAEALEWSLSVQKAVGKLPFAAVMGFTSYERWLFHTWVEALKIRSRETDQLNLYLGGQENKEVDN